jgi:hypothetical protein
MRSRTREEFKFYSNLEDQFKQEFESIQPLIKYFVNDLITWPEIEKSNHVYGGTAFKLFNKNLGHIHANGFIDFPFKGTFRTWLLDEGFAQIHHFSNNLQWVSFGLKNTNDIKHAFELMEISYFTRGQKYFNLQSLAKSFVIERLENNSIYQKLKLNSNYITFIAEQI